MSESTYANNLQERVALGLVHGWRWLRKFGMNHVVPGNSNPVDIWPAASVRTLPSAAGTLSIVSTDADDTVLGKGGNTVTVQGLDANYDEITETVDLAGLTPAVTSQSFLRVNRAFVATANAAGTGNGFNEGEITVTRGSDIQAYIEATEGQTHQAMYTVPAGHTLLIKGYRWTVGRMTGATDIQMKGEIQLFGTGSWRVISDIYAYGPAGYSNPAGATVAPEKTELRVQCISSAATEASGIFDGYLIKNTELQR